MTNASSMLFRKMLGSKEDFSWDTVAQNDAIGKLAGGYLNEMLMSDEQKNARAADEQKRHQEQGSTAQGFKFMNMFENTIGGFFSKLGEDMNKLASDVGNAASGVKSAWGSIKSGEAWENIKTGAASAWEGVKGAANAVTAAVGNLAESTKNWVKYDEFATNDSPVEQSRKYLEDYEKAKDSGQPLTNDHVRIALEAKRQLGLPIDESDYADLQTKETKLREVTNMENYVKNLASSYGRDSDAMMDEMLKLNGCKSINELQEKVANGEKIIEAVDTAWSKDIQKQHYAAYDAMIAMENYNQSIAGFPVSFSMKDSLIYGGATPVISCHTDHQPGINPNALGPLDRLVENMHKLGRNLHDSASEAVNNGNYIDINVSAGWGLGFTGGVIIDNEQNARFYAGGGYVRGGGVTVTWSPNQVTEGFNVGAQLSAFVGISGQVGYSNGSFFNLLKDPSWNNTFWEKGGGLSMGGVIAVTGYHVFKPFYRFNEAKKER